MLRVGGRLGKALVDFDFKHPVIRPQRSHFTELVIKEHHTLVGHSGASHTWVSLRQKCWIIKGDASSSSIYYLSLRCNKIHTIHKNNLQKQNKNNFFHDRRLQGTCYGHLVKQPPIMHLFAHKSFRPTSI